MLLSHADRTRVVSDEHRRLLGRPNGAVPGTLLVDGAVAGHWTVRRAGGTAGRRPSPSRRSAARHRAVRAEVEAEAERLVRFVADDAADHAIAWDAPLGGG